MSQTITIFTDGSCETQTRNGGWAAILQAGSRRKVITGQAHDTTVNQMELTAVINGLSALKTVRQTVEIITDSQYIAKGINQWLPDWIARGWKTSNKKPVANIELWRQVSALLKLHQVSVKWVSRDQNTEADGLAQQARRGELQPDLSRPETSEQRLFIAGSRWATPDMLNYARQAVKRAHELGYTVLVGDNRYGVDQVVVKACQQLGVPVVVAGMDNLPRNGGCRHDQYVKVERDLYRSAKGRLLNRYTVRDRWLADQATMGLFIWNGESRGTEAGYQYMQSRNKDCWLKTFTGAVRRG